MWILPAMHDLNLPQAIGGVLDDGLPRFMSLAASDSVTSLVTPHERLVRSKRRRSGYAS